MRALLLGVLMLALVGCGGGAASGKADTVRPPTVTAPGPSPAAGRAELAGALLTLADLPVGWSVRPSDPTQQFRYCNEVWPATAPIVDARVDFAGDGFTTMQELLRAYTPAGAHAAMDELRGRLQCAEWVTTDGSNVTERAAPLNFPKLGDETIALNLTASGGGGQADVVVVRQGALVLKFAVAGLSIDGDQLARLVRLAVARAAPLAGRAWQAG